MKIVINNVSQPEFISNFTNNEQKAMAYKLSSKYNTDEIEIARFAKALSHPARVAIMKHLTTLNACYFGDINKELPISKATVSQHLAELKRARLIQGSFEPPKVRYCIDKKNWVKARKLLKSFFKVKGNT